MTQNQRLIRYLQDFGSITAYEAVRELGITQLASRICECQNMGYRFNKVTEYSRNRYGEKTHYIRYSLAR